jgi:hypothetical protein
LCQPFPVKQQSRAVFVEPHGHGPFKTACSFRFRSPIAVSCFATLLLSANRLQLRRQHLRSPSSKIIIEGQHSGQPTPRAKIKKCTGRLSPEFGGF